jgi:hypothetical protein
MLMATMVKHLSIYILVLLLGPLPALARPTSDVEAQRSVAGWLARDQRPLRARMGANPSRVKAFKDSAGNIDYFVVSLEPSGFAIVSGDDLLEPIIAFAPQGTFDPNPQNPLFALLNRDLPGRLAEVREKEDQARVQRREFTPRGLHRRARSKWALLQAADTTVSSTAVPSQESVSDVRVAPLVQSKWSQGNEGTQLCYNYYTPYNYLAGCFATAIAQLLRHYSLPSGPVDPFPYTRYDIYVDGSPSFAYLRGGDGSGGAYDWPNMVLDPDGNTGDIQRQAIGALTFDAGVAVHTRYTASGSGSFNQYVPSALMNTFGFGNARYAYNSSYSIPSPNLNNMINPNLDARFPVLLGIIDPDTIGHEIIVDGYGYDNATLYHHLNLGWAGTADAWYNLPTISAGSYNFTSVIECIYNIFPQGSGEVISGRVLDAAGNPVGDATVTATQTSGGSYSTNSNSQGIYALAKIPAASTYTITATKAGYDFLPQTVSTGTSLDGNTAVGNLWGINFVQDSPGITLNQALDNNFLAFTTGGSASWSGQTAVSFYGGSSAQSGTLGGNQSAWLETTVVGPGILSFHWKVSSEVGCDFLEVLVDNASQPGSISGEVDWQQKNISIPAGSHIIKWVYSKDAFAGTGLDCGWVDKVSFRKPSMIPVLELLLLND